ncbi:hypothetical protein MTBBW1_60058 [Desulfamplus magnetovallimortis]|uniref:Glycosyl transferase family 1 domain-containing protein n=1 Tax=Desulfamplus magnetovallimortis TaxID=1246637 RepID=A0A1W1HIF7_9BACT|nr:glycosyltransferase [Desulfamplus magnetovallimortis]SLM32158.1 hypothetical protein MTBBW1_60058 [Desulfamplus magnetovallimortis]
MERVEYFFQAGNPEEIADTIMHIIKNSTEREKMVENAFKKVLKNHTIDSMGERILKIYSHFLL